MNVGVVHLRIAVSGKGGVGKTTVSSILARLLAREGNQVLVVDCDPAPNTASALGIPWEEVQKIVPLCRMSDLIEERTGVKPGQSYGQMFKMNPQVDDLVEKFGIRGKDGVNLLVTGTIEAGGQGCFCPESALLKSLLRHVVKKEKQMIIMDMEAGLEHMGRGTVEDVDLLIIVVEPGIRSAGVAKKIQKLASDIGVKHLGVVINKVSSEKQVETMARALGDLEIMGHLPYSPELVEADLNDISPLEQEGTGDFIEAMNGLKKKIMELVDK
jgi:CO dehydrogenase maturation factor